MRYLSLLLLGPWLIVLTWAYWATGKRFRSSGLRTLCDSAIVVMALIVAFGSALMAYDGAAIHNVGDFGKESGGIWKQVMPALYGYGAFAIVMIAGISMRKIFRNRTQNLRAPEENA
jgi:hypothetical protein